MTHKHEKNGQKIKKTTEQVLHAVWGDRGWFSPDYLLHALNDPTKPIVAVLTMVVDSNIFIQVQQPTPDEQGELVQQILEL